MSDKQQHDGSPSDIVTLAAAEAAYRKQWGALGELAVRSLRAFTGGDQAKFIRLVRRSLAAPHEVFCAFYQSAMRDAVAAGWVPPGTSEWDRQPSTNREAN